MLVNWSGVLLVQVNLSGGLLVHVHCSGGLLFISQFSGSFVNVIVQVVCLCLLTFQGSVGAC